MKNSEVKSEDTPTVDLLRTLQDHVTDEVAPATLRAQRDIETFELEHPEPIDSSEEVRLAALRRKFQDKLIYEMGMRDLLSLAYASFWYVGPGEPS